MAEKKINNFLKHKRIIIVCLVFIGLFLMIFLTYVLTYATNRPKPFKDDKNVKIKNKCEYFDFDCYAKEINSKKITEKGRQMKMVCEISNVKQAISDVKVSYQVLTNWTSKNDYTDSNTTSFNSGNTIPKTTTTTFLSDTETINLTYDFPLKVLPLVRVKNPTVYVKVTYSRKLPDSMKGEGETVTEYAYYSFKYSEYVKAGKTTINE